MLQPFSCGPDSYGVQLTSEGSSVSKNVGSIEDRNKNLIGWLLRIEAKEQAQET